MKVSARYRFPPGELSLRVGDSAEVVSNASLMIVPNPSRIAIMIVYANQYVHEKEIWKTRSANSSMRGALYHDFALVPRQFLSLLLLSEASRQQRT